MRVALLDDATVPAPKHLKAHPFASNDLLGSIYPPKTRVIHSPGEGTTCTLGYAVTQGGARKLLRQFGLETFNKQWDLMLQDWCRGAYLPDTAPSGHIKPKIERADRVPKCLTVQPPLISHHFSKGGSSDIRGQGGGYARGTGTPYVRLSTRYNMENLVYGETTNGLEDQLPDDGKPIW